MTKRDQCKQKKGGFTLLELLVVISIIGILLALGVVAFTTAQRNSRDAKRRADIKSIQDGFEQYYASMDLGNGSYESCEEMFQETSVFPAGQPVDPRNVDPHVYRCTAPYPPYSYCVCAHLETGGGNATGNQCEGYGTAGNFYCLTNLQ